ncbi:protoporphyrinogen oxidase HemJ [Membranicola marinus]|uniref:Protoporphyrinogen IX oxidase n=1 Tax=Membranihabitans marinus TaxID=1227546 RepID=A0A953HQK1_9BACT|nr:protoporphyrinogen oxidase HemJ [Membranihabitans marinus]MBY5956575.1 protoporphyrinogen oxidase HemJ [Membranihabitans marinus]
MFYLITKSIHIIGVVSWFAGLFYLVRLFVYYREAADETTQKQQILQAQYKVMIRRLYQIITTPAMVITLIAGIGMLGLRPELLQTPWMLAKLLLVAGLLVYHWYCGRIIRQLSDQQIKWAPFRLRLFNEVATILLVAIVFLVVLKNTFNALYGLIGFMVFAIVLFAAASWYKTRRKSQKSFKK